MWPIPKSSMGKKLLYATWSFWQGEIKYGKNIERGRICRYFLSKYVKMDRNSARCLGFLVWCLFLFSPVVLHPLNVCVTDHCNPNIKNFVLPLVPVPLLVWILPVRIKLWQVAMQPTSCADKMVKSVERQFENEFIPCQKKDLFWFSPRRQNRSYLWQLGRALLVLTWHCVY